MAGILSAARLRLGIKAWRGMRAFQALDESFRRLVFYSEGRGDWPHLGPIVEELVSARGCRIAYLTSDPSDPGIQFNHALVRAFFIGSASARTILFRSIDCRHFVMTLPDLERFHLKRSVAPVHYVYLFHSLNSTHTSYRQGAFDAYDTVCCAGPHHVDEIRRRERIYGLRPKHLIEHGSVRLDTLMATFGALRATARIQAEPISVLIAPSWGECSLLERPSGRLLIDVLLQAGYRTVVRPHPMTLRRRRADLDLLQQRYASQPRFAVDVNIAAAHSWLDSDVMISDWSGAATEYSFALERPTIFIATPQKLSNPEWHRIGLRAFEDGVREEIGAVVAEDAIATVPSVIQRCLKEPEGLRRRLAAARAAGVFNIGRSIAVAADYLAELYFAAPDADSCHSLVCDRAAAERVRH